MLLAGLAAFSNCTAAPAQEKDDPLSRLRFFLPNDKAKQDIAALIDKLNSDSFDRRDTAFKKLADLPTIPGFIRQRAKEEKRPEVRGRLHNLVELFPIERENHELNAILKQICTQQAKGSLKPLTDIIQLEIWTPHSHWLHQAARTTVTPKDMPLIKENLQSKSASVRQLMAAALGGLPRNISSRHLHQLLSDPSERIVLIAAYSLARLRDKACLPALARLLDSKDFYTRHKSWSALKSLCGKSFGYEPTAALPKRKTAAKKWQKWASSSKAKIKGKLPKNWVIHPFNGKDFTGWEIYEHGKLAPQQTSWKIQDGNLVCLGVHSGDIRTKRRFENYTLTLEYKVDKDNGDGGIGVMLTKENERAAPGARGDAGRYLEVQLLPGNAGDLYSIGNFKAKVNGNDLNFSSPRIAKAPDPSGKWHRLKLTVKNAELKVELNGVLVNQATQGSKGPGKIVIRNEGSKIAYRNLHLHLLQP